MLSKQNRLVTAADYRSTVRRGRRKSSDCAVLYWQASSASAVPRFGFIVSKAVGNAVKRNLVRRRLKNIAQLGLLSSEKPAGPVDIVLRALPGAAQADWVTLEAQVSALFREMDVSINAVPGDRESSGSPAGHENSTRASKPPAVDVKK